MVQSLEPETIQQPFGEISTDRTAPSCPSIFETCVPDMTSQTRTVPSSEPETIPCPSEDNATDHTVTSPVVESHIRMVPSYDVETIRVPSLETATEVTSLICPVMASDNGDQVC